MDINRYKIILDSMERDMNDIKISTHIPNPTDMEYSIGYIRRYFIQKGNDVSSPIYEVTANEYERLISKPLYVGAFLKWRISGPISEMIVDSVLDKGVKESNRIAISLVSHIIPTLKIYLPNLLQFHE
jgi:hypothetical protein